MDAYVCGRYAASATKNDCSDLHARSLNLVSSPKDSGVATDNCYRYTQESHHVIELQFCLIIT